MSYFSQMAGLAVQNFPSAAVGIVIAVALIRGIAGRSGTSLGNFWQDLVRTILWVLLPLSFVASLVLVSQGSIQNFSHYLSFHGIQGLAQTIAMGPVASQEAIKMLGTNGGGFFNTNSAHPFENPNGLHELLRDAPGADHPGGAGLHLRQDGRQPPSGLCHLLNDDDHVPGSGDRLLHRRGPRFARHSTRPVSHHRHRRLYRRQLGRQGATLRHRRIGAL